VDEVFGEALLLRTCEAQVPSYAAVVDPGVPEPAHLLGGLVEHAVAPEHAVEAVEGGVRLGLVVEERGAAGRRVDAAHPASSAGRDCSATRNRLVASNTATARVR